jgi:hypoxanthine-DNA glycosylase
MKHSFNPIANPDAQILILGTIPGEKSLTIQQYYGHAGNQFWKILFALFNESLPTDYAKRKQLLLDKKIALWDVLDNCQREGSSDNSISNSTPNDFSRFYRDHKQIKHVFFNGGNAANYYESLIGITNDRKYYTLPSTSSANTWKSFPEKVKEWSIILDVLSNK